MTSPAGGKPLAGYFCIYTPVELLEACGFVPVRVPLEADNDAQVRGAGWLRHDACPFCRALVGLFERRDPLLSALACVVAPNTCDTMRRTLYVLSEELGIRVLRFFSPRTWQSEASMRIVVQEWERLVRELGAISGTNAGPDELTEAVARWDGVRGALRQLHRLRALDPPPLSGADMLRLVWYAASLDPDESLPLLRQVLQRSTEPNAARLDHLPSARVRLMLAGSMLLRSDIGLVDVLEEQGRACVVTDLLCAGTRWFSLNPAPAGGPGVLHTLAEAYHRRVPCAMRRPNDPLYEFAKAEIRSHRPQGVILRTLKFCDSWAHEAVRMRRELGLPLLHLDVDYSGQDSGQVRTRVEAFLEMLR